MPLTLPLLLVRVNVLVLMVEESMSSLNVALMALLTPTPVALLAGLVELTVGDVVSTSKGAEGGVKLDVQRAMPLEMRSSSSQPFKYQSSIYQLFKPQLGFQPILTVSNEDGIVTFVVLVVPICTPSTYIFQLVAPSLTTAI